LLGNGETLYFGPASQAVDHFAKAGYPCPAYSNPADHVLDLLTSDDTTAEASEQKQKQIQGLIDFYKTKETPIIDPTVTSELQKAAPRIGWPSQVFHVTKRMTLNNMRNMQVRSLLFYELHQSGLSVH